MEIYRLLDALVCFLRQEPLFSLSLNLEHVFIINGYSAGEHNAENKPCDGLASHPGDPACFSQGREKIHSGLGESSKTGTQKKMLSLLVKNMMHTFIKESVPFKVTHART